MAVVAIDGSFCHRSSCARLRNSARVPLPMRLTVVSWPATNSSDHLVDQLVGGEPFALVLARRSAR